LRRDLDLPALELVTALLDDVSDVVVIDGRVRLASATEPEVPGLVPLLSRLGSDPLAAPDAADLDALGLGRAELAAAVRAGRLLRLTEGVYDAPSAPEHALAHLRALADAPFTVSAAREVLGSTRRVVVPLLEHLDAARVTRRLADGTRMLL
jgi:selenocysteine-specific elongation factor